MDKVNLAYVIGVALGDGNLSNPNGRAIRLRITCDARYPKLKRQIIKALKILLPKNKVSIVERHKNFQDISVYSNALEKLLPWKVGKGPKAYQKARVPHWIRNNTLYIRACLRGLLQTDGSIYRDRGYLMVNFTNYTKELADDVFRLLKTLGYHPTFHTTTVAKEVNKYTVRIARNSAELIEEIKLIKK